MGGGNQIGPRMVTLRTTLNPFSRCLDHWVFNFLVALPVLWVRTRCRVDTLL
jgi:hypothetical protein